jgi:YbbR domain-containing protein
MKDFFTKNAGWKLLSLAVAVLLWIAVASEPELSTFLSVPVEYRNLPKDLEINSDVVESVLLEVRGPAGELRGLPEARQRYSVILDMSNVGSGEHTFSIDGGDVSLPRGMHLVRAIPAEVRLNFERGAERSVPVEVRLGGGLPPDLRVVKAVADPASMDVAGPVSRVARVSSVETDPVNLKPEEGTVEYRVNAYISDPRVRFQDSPQVTVKVTLGKK